MKSPRSTFHRAPGTELSDRHRQRQEADRRRAELASARSARASEQSRGVEAARPGPVRDKDAYLKALDEVPFREVGGNRLPVSAIYRDLVSSALDVINDGGVKVALSWPPQDICVSAITSLLALADTAAARSFQILKGGHHVTAAERPNGLRALIYPYARTTHKLARQVQIDRSYLNRLHIRHLTRPETADDRAIKDYHQVLSRTGTLTGRSKDGHRYPEFEHPTLDELVPHGTCDGKTHEKGRLLWRTNAKTDLKDHTRSHAADDGSSAHYFLYGLGHKDNVGSSLRRLKKPVDLVIFDLTRVGRQRLQNNWLSDVKKAAEDIRRSQPDAGFLVVTEDIWTFDAVRFEVFGKPDRYSKKRIEPARSVTYFSRSSTILSDDATYPVAEGCEHVHALGFGGKLLSQVESLRSIGTEMRKFGDTGSAETVREVATRLRRVASLPASLAEFSDYLVGEVGDRSASDWMTGYRVRSEIGTLLDPAHHAFQTGGAKLRATLDDILVSLERQTKTPMSGLIEQALETVMGKSSRSVFIFRSQTLAEFALEVFCGKYPKLRSKLGSGMINFTGPHGLIDIAEMRESVRNQHRRVFFVAPTRESILSVFADPWLPANVIFLSDADTLRFAARDATRLAEQLGEPAVARRLKLFADNASRSVHGLGSHNVELDTAVPPPEDVDFPSEPVIDLTGAGRGDGKLIVITMQSNQRIIARKGTGLVMRERDRSVSTFREVEARDVGEGDEICVISSGFIEDARPLLNITATAAGMIRDYHIRVLERFATLAGHTQSDRLRTLIGKMNDPEVTVQRASYWIDLKDQLDVPISDVVSHAPKDRETFLNFMRALDIGKALAERFWSWAVLMQRASRMKAGFAFHDAYKGILVDPSAAIAANAGREADIRRLRVLAEEFVSTVHSVMEIEA